MIDYEDVNPKVPYARNFASSYVQDEVYHGKESGLDLLLQPPHDGMLGNGHEHSRQLSSDA